MLHEEDESLYPFAFLLYPAPFLFTTVSFAFVLTFSFAFVVVSSSFPFSFTCLPSLDVVDSFFLLLSYEGNVACSWFGNEGQTVVVLYYLSLDLYHLSLDFK